MTTYERQINITEFAQGDTNAWIGSEKIIPKDMIVFSTSDQTIKIGNGEETYSNLEVFINLNDLPNSNDNRAPYILGDEPALADVGKIVKINENGRFIPSDINLSDIISFLYTNKDLNIIQNIDIEVLNEKILLIGTIETGNEGELVIVRNGQYTPSGQTLSELNAEIQLNASKQLGLYIDSVKIYDSINLTREVFSLGNGESYYIKIDAFDENYLPLIYSVSIESNINIIIEQTSDITIKKLTIYESNVADHVTIVSRVDNENITITKSTTISIMDKSCLFGFYLKEHTGSNINKFNSLDFFDNKVIVAGSVVSNLTKRSDCFITAIDTYDLDINQPILFINDENINDDYENVKTYSQFSKAIVDKDSNFVAIGYSKPDLASSIIVKFDSDLSQSYPTIVSKQLLETENEEPYDLINSIVFEDIVDHSTNYFIIGNAYVDNGENTYGFQFIDTFNFNFYDTLSFYYTNTTIDNENDESSSTTQYGALIMKTNNDLSISSTKCIRVDNLDIISNSFTSLYSIMKDRNGLFTAVGVYQDWNASINEKYYKGLIVKFNSDLNMILKKSFELVTPIVNLFNVYFSKIAIDTINNFYFVVGFYYINNNDSSFVPFILKLNSELEIIEKKTIKSFVYSKRTFSSVSINPNSGDIVIVGTHDDNNGLFVLLDKDLNEKYIKSFVSTTNPIQLTDVAFEISPSIDETHNDNNAFCTGTIALNSFIAKVNVAKLMDSLIINGGSGSIGEFIFETIENAAIDDLDELFILKDINIIEEDFNTATYQPSPFFTTEITGLLPYNTVEID